MNMVQQGQVIVLSIDMHKASQYGHLLVLFGILYVLFNIFF